jgi:hypothetical protein
MKGLVLLFLCLLSFQISLHAQNEKPRRVSLGMRSTISLFNHGGTDDAGYGAGGHFRVRLTDRVNTEWFADYLSNNVHDLGFRKDAHIGWSVMYYLRDTKGFTQKLTPYAIAGHCFDYTRIQAYSRTDIIHVAAINKEASRWSSAVQAGLGSHYNITPRFDLSLVAQYMMHLGKDYHIENDGLESFVVLEDHRGIEGHLLISMSLNYKL